MQGYHDRGGRHSLYDTIDVGNNVLNNCSLEIMRLGLRQVAGEKQIKGRHVNASKMLRTGPNSKTRCC